MKKIIKALLVLLSCYLVAVVISNIFVLNVVVSGSSMDDTLESGEFGLADKQIMKLTGIKRFDIVVIEHNNELLVKRIIGLPNEKLEYKNGVLKINDEIIEEDYLKEEYINQNEFSITLEDSQYFVMGDNRKASYDSRNFGAINYDNIKGRLFVIFGQCESDIACNGETCDCVRNYFWPRFL